MVSNHHRAHTYFASVIVENNLREQVNKSVATTRCEVFLIEGTKNGTVLKLNYEKAYDRVS
jgi:hypothetical protein